MFLGQSLPVKYDVVLVGALLTFELLPLDLHGFYQQVVNDRLVTQAHVDNTHPV